jgi:hypothetical protein
MFFYNFYLGGLLAFELPLSLKKVVNHGGSPHPAFGHLLPASGAKGENSPRPILSPTLSARGESAPLARFFLQLPPRPLAGEGSGVRAGGRRAGVRQAREERTHAELARARNLMGCRQTPGRPETLAFPEIPRPRWVKSLCFRWNKRADQKIAQNIDTLLGYIIGCWCKV